MTATISRIEESENPPIVSVIVPVYNVEEYMQACIEGIISQTLKRIEIILIDDGSTDLSPSICDSLAEKDSRIVVIHKQNGGLSDARNTGIRRARGEYLAFIDSDDLVSPYFLEFLYVAAESTGCKISCVPGGEYFSDGEEEKLRIYSSKNDFGEQEVTVLRAKDCIESVLYQRITTGTQWRLYSRDVLGTDPFPKGALYEDTATTYQFLHRAGTIALVENKDLYAYRVRKSGIVRQRYSNQKLESALCVTRKMYSDICSMYKDLEPAAASRAFSINRMVFAQVPRGCEDRYILWNEMKKYRSIVLSDKNARKRERLAALIATLGIRPFSLFCSACRRAGLLQ